MADSQFDPYAVLKALDRHRVTYIVIGAFARVIHGTEELTRGIDIVPSTRPENVRRLEEALRELNAQHDDGRDVRLDEHSLEPVISLRSDAGELKIVPEPIGTRGYDDLRRAASREPLGQGVRPSVASPGDLARMLGARGRDVDLENLRMLRRLIALERSRGLSWER
ncbi:MAG: hypothetical protein ACJ76U_10435 [Gaiellaceae bacterium]